MNRRIRFLFAMAMLLAATLLSGCWDRRELNELAISVAMGIDKAGDQYKVTVQVVQPGEVAAKKGGSSGSTPVTVYESKGATIFEAIRRLTIVSPRKAYGAHLRIVVFGEELAREGLGNALDMLSRNYELRTDFYMLVSKGSRASRVVDILTPLNQIPANKVFGGIETAEKLWAPVATMTLDQFITEIESKGTNPILSGIEIIGKDEAGTSMSNLTTTRPSARLHIGDLAVFREDRLIGWLNETESKGYNYIIDNVSSTVGHVTCPDGGIAALEVMDSDAEIQGTVVNGRPRLGVDIRVEANVGEVQCRIDLKKQLAIRQLEQRMENTLTRIVSRTIRTAQQTYESDIFGFGNAIHRRHPREWKSLRSEWDQHFRDAPVKVAVQVKIKRTGTIMNTFSKEEGE